MPSPAEVVERQDAQLVAAVGPRREHHVPDVRVHLLQPLGRVLGSHRQPGRRVLVARAWHRAPRQPELGRLVVRHQQQLVGAVRVLQVLGVVLHPAAAPADRQRRTLGLAGVQDPDLARVPVLRPDHHQLAGPGRVQHELELLVRLLQHQPVLGGGRAHPVPPDLVLPPHVVVHGVEEVRRVRRPGATDGRSRHDVGQVLTRGQVAEAQLVDLVTVEVHRVGEQRGVRGDRPLTQLHVVRVPDKLVDVEQQLVLLLGARRVSPT